MNNAASLYSPQDSTAFLMKTPRRGSRSSPLMEIRRMCDDATHVYGEMTRTNKPDKTGPREGVVRAVEDW